MYPVYELASCCSVYCPLLFVLVNVYVVHLGLVQKFAPSCAADTALI